MKCPNCDSEMICRRASRSEPYNYKWSGLNHIQLVGISVYSCGDCHSVFPQISMIDDLHEAIAGALMSKDGILTSAELRFLRKNAEISSGEFARRLGITPEHLSRVENRKLPVSRQLDRLARVYVAAEKNVTPRLLGLDEDLKSMSGMIFRRKPDGWEARIKAA